LVQEGLSLTQAKRVAGKGAVSDLRKNAPAHTKLKRMAKIYSLGRPWGIFHVQFRMMVMVNAQRGVRWRGGKKRKRGITRPRPFGGQMDKTHPKSQATHRFDDQGKVN